MLYGLAYFIEFQVFVYKIHNMDPEFKVQRKGLY